MNYASTWDSATINEMSDEDYHQMVCDYDEWRASLSCEDCDGNGYALIGHAPTWDAPHGDCEEIECENCKGTGQKIA